MTATIILYGASFCGLSAIIWLGETTDRIAAVMFLAAMAITPIAENLLLSNWRMGASLVDIALLIGFWTLAERCNRWWFVMAAGFQLIAVITFLVPWFMPGVYFMWTGVTIRMAVWMLLSITFFIGAWEAWAARRFAKEAQPDACPDLRRGRPPLAKP